MGAAGSFYAARPQSASFQASIQDPTAEAFFAPLRERITANLPRELFPGAIALANIVAGIGASLTGFGAFFGAASTLAENVERSQSGMALNIGGILSGVGSVLGGANLGQYSGFSQLLGGGLQIAGAALAPTPQITYASQPIYGAMPYPQPAAPAAVPTMSAAPIIGAAAGAIARVTAPILAKIAAKLGLRNRPSLQRAIDIVRKAAKILQSPEAVAVALGITTAELATLIVSHNARKRRTMNPANAKALRRAARRIKSFHRMCTHVDLIKTRRHSASRSGCFKCGKRKCSC